MYFSFYMLDRGSMKQKYFFLLKKRIPGCFVASDESMSALFTQQLSLSLTSAVGHNIPSLLLATEVWKYYCWPIFLIKYHQKRNMYKRTGEHLPPVWHHFNHPKQRPHAVPDDLLEGCGVIGDPQQCHNGILTSKVDTGR